MKEQIVELLKARGLHAGENALEDILNMAMDIISVVVENTETPIDNIAYAAMNQQVRDLIAKIDLDKDGE